MTWCDILHFLCAYYVLNMTDQSFLVLIGGVMGSGKTTLGAHLLATLEGQGVRATHVDIDDVARTVSPPFVGNEAYRQLEALVSTLCATGRSLIVSATLRERRHRDGLVSISREAGYRTIGVFLYPSMEIAIDRAVHREDIPGHAHLLSAEQAAAQIPDWMNHFSTGDHGDLLGDPWLVCEGTPTLEVLLAGTQERMRELLVPTSPEWISPHPTSERW